MAVINHAKREINAKIVYFGSPGCGKGDLLRFIHQRIKPDLCGPLKTMPAGSDTLLFFDYIPYETSSLDGYRIRFHLYTLTGPVANPGTWKMTLKGVDGLVFVTAAKTAGSASSAESLRVLRSMLTAYGKDLCSLPRLWLSCDEGKDLPGISEFEASLYENRRVCCSLATGDGVLKALAQLSQSVLQQLRQEYDPAVEPVFAVEPTESCTAFHPDNPAGQGQQIVTLPEIKMTLTENSVVQIPIALQSGGKVKRCVLSLSLQLEQGPL